ncbi:MAG TPA: sigma-70 family RNA polymerase sigma factor [Chloroflexia bacterium]|nr:sigma-70 family RNA polymerase sigma factor [Chloroflexia bacterium]
MQERAAITRLKKGDIGGLDALVRLHQQTALAAAFLVCRDQALAEDLVQAAFIRAYDRIAQLDVSRPFGPWFIRSVVNDALKAVGRNRLVPLDPDWEGGSSAPTEDPEALLLAAETRDAVWVLLDRLSPDQRAAVVLRYYCDLTDAEVAVRLAVPPGTVRRRLHDARQRLRQLMPLWLRPTGQ